MGRILRVVGALFLVTTLLVGGLVGAYALGYIQQPSATVVDPGDWGEVTQEETEVLTTVRVRNPNPVGIGWAGAGVAYDLSLNGVRVAEGEKTGLDIGPGNNTVQLVTAIQNEQLQPWWVNFVQNDETVRLQADVAARVTLGPLNESFSLPPVERRMLENETPVRDVLSSSAASLEGDYTREVSVSRGGLSASVGAGYVVERGWATWGPVTNETTAVRYHFRIRNGGDVPVPAVPDGLAAKIALNDVELIRTEGEAFDANVSGDATIAPGETHEVVYTLTMDNSKVDDWFRSHVRRGEQTHVETEFQMVFEVRGQTFRLPQESAGFDCDVQTAILVDDQQTETSCGGAGTAGPA